MNSKTVYLDPYLYTISHKGNVRRNLIVHHKYADGSISPEYQKQDKGTGQRVEYGEPVWKAYKTKYKLGAEALLMSIEDVSPQGIRKGKNTRVFYLNFEAVIEGTPGNLDRGNKKFHGCRGTAYSPVYAYGVRKIIRIHQLKNGKIAVTVGTDLNPDDK